MQDKATKGRSSRLLETLERLAESVDQQYPQQDTDSVRTDLPSCLPKMAENDLDLRASSSH